MLKSTAFAVVALLPVTALCWIESTIAADGVARFQRSITDTFYASNRVPDIEERLHRETREEIARFRQAQREAGVSVDELNRRTKELLAQLEQENAARIAHAIENLSRSLTGHETHLLRDGMDFLALLEATAAIEQTSIGRTGSGGRREHHLEAVYEPTTILYPMQIRSLPEFDGMKHRLRAISNSISKRLGTVAAEVDSAAGNVPLQQSLRLGYWQKALSVLEGIDRIRRASFVVWADSRKRPVARFLGARVDYRTSYQPRTGADTTVESVTIEDITGFSSVDRPDVWTPAHSPEITILQFTPEDLLLVEQGLLDLSSPDFSTSSEERDLLYKLWSLGDQFTGGLRRRVPRDLLDLARREHDAGIYHIDLATRAFDRMPVHWTGRYEAVVKPAIGASASHREVKQIDLKSYIDRLTGNQSLFIRLPVSPAYSLIGTQDLDLGDAAERRFQATVRLGGLRGDVDIKRTGTGLAAQGHWRDMAWGLVEIELGVSPFASGGAHAYQIGWAAKPGAIEDTAPRLAGPVRRRMP